METRVEVRCHGECLPPKFTVARVFPMTVHHATLIPCNGISGMKNDFDQGKPFICHRDGNSSERKAVEQEEVKLETNVF